MFKRSVLCGVLLLGGVTVADMGNRISLKDSLREFCCIDGS
jgi:hypothetical protein